MYASNSHSYTYLILALGIVREPTVWVFITSEYPGMHDIGLPTIPHTARSDVSRMKVSVVCALSHLHPLLGLLPVLLLELGVAAIEFTNSRRNSLFFFDFMFLLVSDLV